MIKDSEDKKLSVEDRLNLDEEVAIDASLVSDLESEESTISESDDIDTDTSAKNIDEDSVSPKPISLASTEVESPRDSNSKQSKEDKELTQAINEIATKDSDLLLEIEDEERQSLSLSNDSIKRRGLKSWIIDTWSDPVKRGLILGGIFICFITLSIVPNSRYFLLNSAGVRSSVELTVVDKSTLQPLKNVLIKVGNSESKTDHNGFAKLEKVSLGKTNLVIEKRAFKTQIKHITVGWGSNPQGSYKVEPTGSQYAFSVKDYLSHEPLSKVEAVSGDSSAFSDENGRIVLVMDTKNMEDSTELDIELILKGYRKESLGISVNNKELQSVEMVTSRPHVFVSKRSGKYDLYKIDIDGKNEEKILGGQGLERDDMSVLPHPSKNLVVYIATRENVRNQSGYILSTAYIIDVDNKDTLKFDQSEQIKLIGWTDSEKLVYIKVAAGESGTSSKRHRLMTLDLANLNENAKELASSNYFNDVAIFGDTIYYAPSNIFNEESVISAYSIKADGRDKKVVVDKEVFSIVRTDYKTLYFSTNSEWYKLSNANSGQKATLDHVPGEQKSRLYSDYKNSKFSLWVDNRDGKGVLLSYDKSTEHEKVLVQRGGLKYPIYWLDKDNAIFRVKDGRETADYIVNIISGNSKKIVDTTDTNGINSWY